MPLPPNPTVTMRFTGLLAFCFDKKFKYCQVGFHTKAIGHEVRVGVSKKRQGQITAAIPMLKFSHEMIHSSSDLWLDIEGATPPKQQTAEPYIVNNQGSTPIDDQDFRRVVDFEGKDFYGRRLNIKSGVLTPSLYIGKGLFYTAELTSHPYVAVSVDATVNDRHLHTHPTTEYDSARHASGRRLGQIATSIGVNIYLDHDSQALVLRAGKKFGAELFRLNREEGVTYEVTIDNNDNGLSPPSHPGSHFGLYYDAFDLNPKESKILIEPNGIPPSGDCIVTRFSKSHSLGVEACPLYRFLR